jgi:hypothetical protein
MRREWDWNLRSTVERLAKDLMEVDWRSGEHRASTDVYVGFKVSWKMEERRVVVTPFKLIADATGENVMDTRDIRRAIEQALMRSELVDDCDGNGDVH